MKRVFRLRRINGLPHPFDDKPKTFVRYIVIGFSGMHHAWCTEPNRHRLGKVEREHGKDAWVAVAWDGLRLVAKGRFKRRADAARAIVTHFYPQFSPVCRAIDPESGQRCQRLAGHGSARHWSMSDEFFVQWEPERARTALRVSEHDEQIEKEMEAGWPKMSNTDERDAAVVAVYGGNTIVEAKP